MHKSWKALAPLMTKTEGEGSMGRILKDLILFKRLKVRKRANLFDIFGLRGLRIPWRGAAL